MAFLALAAGACNIYTFYSDITRTTQMLYVRCKSIHIFTQSHMKPFIITIFTRSSHLLSFYGLRANLTTGILCSSQPQSMFEDLGRTRSGYTYVCMWFRAVWQWDSSLFRVVFFCIIAHQLMAYYVVFVFFSLIRKISQWQRKYGKIY